MAPSATCTWVCARCAPGDPSHPADSQASRFERVNALPKTEKGETALLSVSAPTGIRGDAQVSPEHLGPFQGWAETPAHPGDHGKLSKGVCDGSSGWSLGVGGSVCLQCPSHSCTLCSCVQTEALCGPHSGRAHSARPRRVHGCPRAAPCPLTTVCRDDFMAAVTSSLLVQGTAHEASWSPAPWAWVFSS